MLPQEFRVAAVLERENTADILVTRDGSTLAALPAGARLGTSSSRRRFQALRMNRGLEILPLRGNVDTRLARVADGSFDAIIVAMAGVKRLGRADDVKFVELDARDFIPAGGQGALAIETLADSKADDLDRAVARSTTRAHSMKPQPSARSSPRSVRRARRRSGVRARIDGDLLKLAAMLFSPDGARELSDSMSDPIAPDLAPAAAEHSGKRLAEKMLARGAARPA